MKTEIASFPYRLCTGSYRNRNIGNCRFSWWRFAVSAECGRSCVLSCLLDFNGLPPGFSLCNSATRTVEAPLSGWRYLEPGQVSAVVAFIPGIIYPNPQGQACKPLCYRRPQSKSNKVYLQHLSLLLWVDFSARQINAIRSLDLTIQTLLRRHMTTTRKSIPLNTARQLWGQCGGFCQNPSCNKPLFRGVEDQSVSIANVAHIIGHGSAGPRSDHELAEHIDRDGVDNLIMLCLECHKVVDELDKEFTAEEMISWKTTHTRKITLLFSIPNIRDERELLTELNDLLEENASLFRECGPYSENVLGGLGGDGLKVWKKRCLDTILPNNQRIIALIEHNKRNFPYPWDIYSKMFEYKIHVDAFQDNCLTDQKINDYKLFPRGFDYFIKYRLGIASSPPEVVAEEELEFRYNTIKTFVERFLSSHNAIENLQELNRGTMLVRLRDGRTLKVFVTNTYYFTDYTLDRVLEVDPAINAIICSSPAGQYSDSAKSECIERGIGLFMLGEFMGAIHQSGDQYLNFLLKADREQRTRDLKRLSQEATPPPRTRVFAFGSFLRRKHYQDVDLMIVYGAPAETGSLKLFESELARLTRKQFGVPDIAVASDGEFTALRLKYDNLSQVYP